MTETTEELETEKHPPLIWFTAVGNKEKGIRNVRVNEHFIDLDAGGVGRMYGQWKHYTLNPSEEDDSPERKKRAVEILDEAETYIFSVTGFRPEQIHNMERDLNDQCRGKKEAPCEVEIY